MASPTSLTEPPMSQIDSVRHRLGTHQDSFPRSVAMRWVLRLAIAIGEVGANISALQGFEVKTATLDEDLVVNCRSEAPSRVCGSYRSTIGR